MNGIIPALLAVLFAELGERSAMFANVRARASFAGILGILIAVAAAGGAMVAPEMNERAETLMVAIALLFAGIGQFRRPKAVDRFDRVLFTFWGGGTLLIAFAFGAKFGPLTAALGTILGLGGALTLSVAAKGAGWKLTALSRSGAVILIIVSGIIAPFALRAA